MTEDGAQGGVVAAGMGLSPSSIRGCERSNGVVACDADGRCPQGLAEVGRGGNRKVVEQTPEAGDVAVEGGWLHIEEVGHRPQAHPLDAAAVDHGEPGVDDVVVVESSLAGHALRIRLEEP